MKVLGKKLWSGHFWETRGTTRQPVDANDDETVRWVLDEALMLANAEGYPDAAVALDTGKAGAELEQVDHQTIRVTIRELVEV